jgi:hypothetical protein
MWIDWYWKYQPAEPEYEVWWRVSEANESQSSFSWGSVFCIFWIMWFFLRKYKYICIRVYVWFYRFKDDKHVIWMWIWLILQFISLLDRKWRLWLEFLQVYIIVKIVEFFL